MCIFGMLTNLLAVAACVHTAVLIPMLAQHTGIVLVLVAVIYYTAAAIVGCIAMLAGLPAYVVSWEVEVCTQPPPPCRSLFCAAPFFDVCVPGQARTVLISVFGLVVFLL